MKIQIQKPVRANDSSMKEEDILTIKSALHHLGFYEEPDYGLTGYPDHQMFASIKNFQKAKDLKIDGIINPEGETIKSINKEIKVSARGPVIRCTECGGPHGGSKGDLCPDRDSKQGEFYL